MEQSVAQHDGLVARNRENQRRSRARKKEYVTELEARIRQYERDGAQATTVIQRAARRVADENTHLRNLLGLHGVSQDKIDTYLSQVRDSPKATASTKQTAMYCAPSEQRQAVLPAFTLIAQHTISKTDNSNFSELTNASIPHDADAEPLYSISPPELHHEEADTIEPSDAVTIPSPDAKPDGCCSGKTSCTFPTPIEQPANPPLEIPTGTNSTHFFPPPRYADSARDERISCMEAAKIIAKMRGHDDSEAVWSEIGCKEGQIDCSIKKLQIFELV